MISFLALISGEKLLDSLFVLLVWAVILGVLWWGFSKVALPDPWKMVANVFLVVLTCVVLINWLLGLIGHSVVKW